MRPACTAFQVPQRPIIAVYHHVRRSYHPMKQQGKWMESEDASLLQSVLDPIPFADPGTDGTLYLPER